MCLVVTLASCLTFTEVGFFSESLIGIWQIFGWFASGSNSSVHVRRIKWGKHRMVSRRLLIESRKKSNQKICDCGREKESFEHVTNVNVSVSQGLLKDGTLSPNYLH